MAINIEQYNKIVSFCNDKNVTLVAVSKIKPAEDIQALYNLGQRDFGENYVQELVAKEAILPKDIRWHHIGHLQSNKVKYIAPFVHLIHGVDSEKLLTEINKQAAKNDRVIHCLLQVHIATEETKFGFDETELKTVLNNLESLKNIQVDGLMGMASFSDNPQQVRSELRSLKVIFNKYSSLTVANATFTILSMGMSGDYIMAVEEGSTMIRIGSLLFGARM
ncbi:MAG: YggS family pyridoxal phosphate-dependent enzyme [Bacteroidota bacterium]